MYSNIGYALNRLQNGNLIIVIDDIKTGIGYLMGNAENVKANNVNLMTKIGKGLVYVTISEEKAMYLNLPLINNKNTEKNFTVSIDYKTTTTGISAFERADTIQALTVQSIKPEDFKRPGHIFPLVYSKNGLLDYIGIAEAASDCTRMARSASDESYLCEILNTQGELATREEVEDISRVHDIPYITISEVFNQRKNDFICLLEGKTSNEDVISEKFGYLTLNLPITQDDHLKSGVYGVKVHHNEIVYKGIMNARVRPSAGENNQNKTYEIYVLDSNKSINLEKIKVEVKFFMREEEKFTTINDLFFQIESDIREVRYWFDMLEGGMMECLQIENVLSM